MAQKKRKHFYDYSLLAVIIFLTVFGLIMIYSASSYTAQIKMDNPGYYMWRQAGIAGAGFVFMIVISLVDYHFWVKNSIWLYLVSYPLLIATMLFGREINGRKRWLVIAGQSFQPTEVVKIGIILFLSLVIVYLMQNKLINTWKGLGIIFAIDIPLAILVAANNLSSGIIIFLLAFIMSFVATNKKAVYAGAAALGALAIAFVKPIAESLQSIGLLKPYQLGRILVWLEPEAHPLDGGYQVLQGLYAIGSGGFWGKGLGESIQKLGFVPEAQNDMIFTIICEELGLFGGICVIAVFGFMIYRLFVLANSAPDRYGSFICIGVMAHIAIQVILNIAVVCNAIPNTGVTLPFISYGGTSVFFLMCEMGLVLGVSRSIKLDY